MFGIAWSIACSITWAQTDQQIAWTRKRSFTHTMTQCIYIYDQRSSTKWVQTNTRKFDNTNNVGKKINSKTFNDSKFQKLAYLLKGPQTNFEK